MYGMGLSHKRYIHKRLGVDFVDNIILNFKDELVIKFNNLVINMLVGLNLFNVKRLERKRLSFLLNYRSVRFLNNLPCNGQRTQTNALTCKKKRKEDVKGNSSFGWKKKAGVKLTNDFMKFFIGKRKIINKNFHEFMFNCKFLLLRKEKSLKLKIFKKVQSKFQFTKPLQLKWFWIKRFGSVKLLKKVLIRRFGIRNFTKDQLDILNNIFFKKFFEKYKTK